MADNKINKRIIKFRGKQKSWIYGGICVYKNGDVTIFDQLGQAFEVDPKSVGQFTGIKGKGGVDIYENDFLKVTSWPYKAHSQELDFSDPHHSIEQVVYDEDRFRLGIISEFNWEDEYEVIGNTTDNPELLK
jgi:uncharacterized phage protein (TIGR01671 family)